MLPLLSPNGTYHIITDDSFVLEIICSATTYNHTYVSCRDQKSQQSEKVLLLVLGEYISAIIITIMIIAIMLCWHHWKSLGISSGLGLRANARSARELGGKTCFNLFVCLFRRR